jgi:hypothetical protein
LPIYAVAIEKQVSFRLANQPFANVYHYEGATLTAANATALANSVKTKEVDLHSLDVTFIHYRVWSAGGTPASNNMIAQGNLSGTGNQASNTSMDRERAVLVQWPAGVNIRGQPVTLKKWYHSCGSCAGITFPASLLQNTAEIPAANRTTIATAANALLSDSVGGNVYNLVAASGRPATGTCVAHRFLEHHQLGDQWR